MNIDTLLIRRGIVLTSVVVYWIGVWVQSRRIRRRIGRSPNLKPHGLKEQLLWLGWLLVVLAWIALPFLVREESHLSLAQLHGELLHPAGLMAGAALILAGYGGTLWCYASMGENWRIGVDRNEQSRLVTSGPYAAVRHPIYLFQMVMLAGAVLLLPSWLPLVILGVHLFCVWIKAADEEHYLLKTHGPDYQSYLQRTGRLLPPLLKRG